MPNEFVIKNGFISQGNSIVNGSLTATTYYGDGSNLTGVPNFYVTGGTYSNGTLTLNRQNGSVTITGFTTGFTSVDTYVTGFTYDNSNKLTVSRNNGLSDINVYLNQFSGLTVNGIVSATTFNGSGLGLNNIPIAGVTNLQNILDSKTDLSLFNSHTANTNNPHQTSFNQLTSTAHTHTISDITNLQSSLNLKFDKSGGTVTGDVLVLGNVTILGTATTINTTTLTIQDNIITLNSNATGSTAPLPINSGIEILRNSGTTASVLWEETNGYWSAGLNGTTKRIILEGDSLALLTSGHTHPISEINGLQGILNNKFDASGGTITGNVLINGFLTATTYYGDGSNLTGLVTNDFYVTGGTYSNGTLTLNRQNGSVTITGFTTEIITAGENLVYGDLVYLSGDSKYYKTSNSSDSTSSTELRISLDTINSNNTGVALIKGKFTTTGLVPGDIYIVGYSAGTITNTEPIADGSIIRIVGTSLDSTTLEFNPDQTYLEISSGIPVEPPNCIPDLYVTNLHSCSPLYINPNNEGNIYFGSANNFVIDVQNGRVGINTASPTSELDLGSGILKAGTVEVSTITITSPNSISISNVNGLQTALDSKADSTTLSTHISDLNNPHQTSFYGLTSTAHTHTTSEISGLNGELNLKTNLTNFVSHTANTNNPHQTSFYGLTSTAHTHTISDITDLSNQLNNKLNTSGGIITGSLTVNGNLVTLGTATTINTETLSIKDNLISLNSNLTGNTEPFFGDSGLQIIRGSGNTANLFWSEFYNYWVAGLSGSTKKIILQGDGLSLLNSAHTHTISEIIGLNNQLNNKFDKSGGTISNNVTIIGTLSATTLYGNGQYLTGLVTNDFYVTGGTFVGTTLTLNRQNGSVTITGFTSGGGSGTFTGGTISGNLTISSLSGSTDRMMEVNSSGLVSAQRTIITAYLISGSTQANLLENTNNWGNKVYTGTTITGTYQGQKHYNSDYLFEAVDNNLWIRLSRV